MRVLLKLSGEALDGENKTGIAPEVLDDITSQVKDLRDLGVDDKLREMGVREGDTVRILDYELEWE